MSWWLKCRIEGILIEELDLTVRYLYVASIYARTDNIESIHNMGALSLNTSSLKSQLKGECAAWKTKYCQNLHRQAKDSLENLTEYMRVRAQTLSVPACVPRLSLEGMLHL